MLEVVVKDILYIVYQLVITLLEKYNCMEMRHTKKYKLCFSEAYIRLAKVKLIYIHKQ